MGRRRSKPRPNSFKELVKSLDENPVGEPEEDLQLDEPLNGVQMGSAAERLLRDPAFSKAMDKAYSRCFSEWQEAESVEGREKAHAHLMALNLVENELGILVSSGILEAGQGAATVM